MRTQLLTSALILSLTACAAETGAGTPDGDKASANPDGRNFFERHGAPIAAGNRRSGFVSGGAEDVYAIMLSPGDVVAVELRWDAGGQLEPMAELFSSTSVLYEHDEGTLEVAETSERKTYTIPAEATAGTWGIVVSAKPPGGIGTYELLVHEPGNAPTDPVPTLDPVMAATCIGQARGCAFGHVHSGRVPAPTTVSLARQVFDTCLGDAASSLGAECASACEGPDAEAFCHDIATGLHSLGGRGAECINELGTCMADCTLKEENSPWLDHDDAGLDLQGEYLCWMSRDGSSCLQYAADHVACGGTDHPAEPTLQSCEARCRAVAEPWDEGLDDASCDCGFACEGLQVTCENECGADDACVDDCIASRDGEGDWCTP